MNPPLPALLAEQPRRSASTLSIEDAWMAALAWHDRLRDKVLLEGVSDVRSDGARSYGWIFFAVDMSNRKDASAARAAAVTWFSLSCCPGYGGHENPVFWKCVISEHSRVTAGGGGQGTRAMASFVRVGTTITDACSFFGAGDHDFPRFKISACWEQANVLLFFGHPSQQLERQDQVKLKQLVLLLAPSVDRQRSIRRPVAHLENIQASRKPMHLGLSSPSTDAGWSSPVFLVQVLDTDPALSDRKQREWYLDIFRNYDVEISSFVCDYNSEVSPDLLSPVVRSVLRLPGSGARARTRVLTLEASHPISLVAFASALPATTSITSVQFDFSEGAIEKPAIAWMAYALFHPDTPASSWRSLFIRVRALTEPYVAVLKAMARGNNLAAILEGRKATANGYYRARLAPNAKVYDRSSGSNTERGKTSVVATSDGSLEVEVCDVASDDPTQWSKWVTVVVPAYGLGWVQSADVTSVVKRASAEASLTKLGVSCYRCGVRSAILKLQSLLSMVGRRLLHLDLSGYFVVASLAEVKQVLSYCPSLESLKINDNGALWVKADMEMVLPHLRELYLHLIARERGDDNLVAFNPPRSLQVLRVSASGVATRRVDHVYSGSLDAVRVILSQPSRLRLFHWEDERYQLEYPSTYAETCADTARRLEALGLDSSQNGDIRLPSACAAAFLSVLVHEESQHSARARLDEDLSKVIVDFAGTRVTRVVVLEPEAGRVRPERRLRRFRSHSRSLHSFHDSAG